MRRAPKQSPLALGQGCAVDPGESLEGWDCVERRGQRITRDMAWYDSLPPALRTIASGLPLQSGPTGLADLLAAIEAGCTTPAEAEDWLRSMIGPSVVESLGRMN